MLIIKARLWWTSALGRKGCSSLPPWSRLYNPTSLMPWIHAPPWQLSFRHHLCHWQSGSNKETKQALTHSSVTKSLPGHTPDGLPRTGTSRKNTAGAGSPFLPDAQLKRWCELIRFANIWHFKPALWWRWHVTVQEARPLPQGVMSGLELDPM